MGEELPRSGASLSDSATSDILYERFLYARGYLLTSFPAVPPKSSWTSVSIAGLHLSFDPANAFATADAKQWWRVGRPASATIAILGYVLDTETSNDDPAWIAKSAAAALAKSEAALLDLIDAWSGRFLLVFRAEGRTRILTDACALRSAYYSFRSGLCVASHARLTADAVGTGTCRLVEKSRKDPRWRGSVGEFPGAATRFEDVWVLTPNTLIDVEARLVRRFFPRAPLPSISSDDAAEIVAPILAGSVQAVSTRYACVASLTGGIDSRVTLAAAKKSQKRITFFTYVEKGEVSHEKDFAIARRIANAARLEHRRLDLGPVKTPMRKALSAALKDSTHTLQMKLVLYAYCEAFPDKAVHLRSNLGEIGRAFYRKSRPLVSHFDGKAMADVFKKTPMSDNRGVLSMFERFYEVSEFSRIQNYDPYDMFYWEQRMSSWHAGVVLGSDVAFDTFIIYNNRKILMPLLAAPLEDRIVSTSFSKIINLLWPDLLRWRFC